MNECLKDTKVHLKSLNLALLNSDSYPSEYQLILNIAGLPDLDNFYCLQICAHHRNELGVRYYNKKKCESPDHPNELGSKFRNINLEKSQFLLSQKNKKNKTHCVGDAILIMVCFGLETEWHDFKNVNFSLFFRLSLTSI